MHMLLLHSRQRALLSQRLMSAEFLIRFRCTSHCPDVPAGNLASYSMSGKVVGDDKQPKFPEQSQEFIGTVRQHQPD